MSKPNLSVAIEPLVGSSIVYEPVTPKEAGGKPQGVLCLRLAITNHESKSIHMNKVSVAFASPPAVPTATILVPANWYPPDGSGVDIAPGSTYTWCFMRESFENDGIVLPSPAPSALTVSLFFNGFSDPWSVTNPLAAHQNPVTGHAYVHPGRTEDLRDGEFWLTSSNTHGTGAQGSQLFAYDMIVAIWDSSAKQSNRLLPGKNGTKNDHYRIWGKPIHAMADGTVAHFLDGVGANYFPGTGNDAGPWKEAPWDTSTQAGKDKSWTDHVGAGNHFYIRHGEELVLYAHMQSGTLPQKFLKKDAVVKAGDLLGLAGNAGSSSEPHTHIHAIKGTVAESGPLRPLLFRDMFAIDPGKLAADNSGPWQRVEVQGPPIVPATNAFIWPLKRSPEWRGWQDLGHPVTVAPAVASWAAHRLDVFSAGTDKKLNHKWWDGSSWHNWQTLGGVFKEGPAAVSWGPNRIDVFVRGMDDHLGHLWWDGSKWQGWEDLGGPIASGPAVTSWGPNRLDVFAEGNDGKLKHKWWDGSKWHDWQTLGGTFKGMPAAVSWGPDRIDIFVRGMDDHLGHFWWNGNSWHGWEDLGGPITSAPAVASWGSNRLDVFAAGPDGNLEHKWWNGQKWSEWDWVGGVFHDQPAAVSWGPNRIDVFVRGMDDHLGHLWRG